MVDEVTPDDTDYIYATAAGAICNLGLNDTTYPGTPSQTISFRGWSNTGKSIKVYLINTANAAVVRSVTQVLSATRTQFDVVLTSGEIALITSGAMSIQLESA